MDEVPTLAADTMPGRTSHEPVGELPRGTVVGRYLLLGKLGAGGMGVVYAAHDPELDRKVAVKLVLSQAGGSAAGRARLVREAQALARLAHPNVVAIHDAGTFAGRVWIAMEFVEGETLRAWAERTRPGWSEMHRVLRDAARGVAAAHAAGLVHCDLKPDNVMVGADARVRVMDFGLASGRGVAADDGGRVSPDHALDATVPGTGAPRLTRGGAIAGTPAYMAPEQWQGHDATAAADQFGWSVMAWELLYGERPFAGETMAALVVAVTEGKHRPPARGRRVPAWLRRVVERGLARAPEDRWPSMAALLQALERGRSRARVWRVGAAIVGVTALVAGIEGLRQQGEARRVAACVATGAEIDEAWHDEARRRLRAAFTATGVGYAATTADRTVPALDEQAAAWKQARTAACLDAEVRGRWTSDIAGRAVWCLEERRMELAALIAEFGRADATAVQKAVAAVTSLRPADMCLDEGLLQRQPDPPTQGRDQVREVRAALSRVRSLELAGHYAEALTGATEARERAAALVWPPLWLAARATESDLLEKTGDYAAAEEVGKQAYFAAARADVWEVASIVATRMIVLVGYRLARHSEGREWARHAEVAIGHVGGRVDFREASRLSSLAIVHQGEGDYAGAKALHEQTAEIRERLLGPAHPDVARSLNNLGTVLFALADYPAARALHERVLAILETTLGADHPDVAASLNNLAAVEQVTGEYAEARVLHERALAIREAALSPDHPDIVGSLVNLGLVLGALGETAEARALLERALAIQERSLGPDHPGLAVVLEALAVVAERDRDNARAQALYERALAIREKATGLAHPDLAASMMGLADARLATGPRAEVRALYERALALREQSMGPKHPDVAEALTGLARWHVAGGDPASALPLLGRAVAIFEAHEGFHKEEPAAEFALAEALIATGGDRARAVTAATRARDGLRAEGSGQREQLAAVEAWLARHTR